MGEKIQLDLTPRFNDTDGLGHINNATYATWFETARRPIFRVFNPGLDLKLWNLIIARIEIDFLAQCHYEYDVKVLTWLEKLGTSSMRIVQTVEQENKEVARGLCVMVHFDYSLEKSAPITAEQRTQLERYLIT
jgi:acyl-CoA thioester hydrolase